MTDFTFGLAKIDVTFGGEGNAAARIRIFAFCGQVFQSIRPSRESAPSCHLGPAASPVGHPAWVNGVVRHDAPMASALGSERREERWEKTTQKSSADFTLTRATGTRDEQPAARPSFRLLPAQAMGCIVRRWQTSMPSSKSSQ